MGKSENRHLQQQQLSSSVAVGAGGAPAACAARIRRALSLRCVLVLLLSAAAILSTLFSLPLSRTWQTGFVSDDADTLSADIKASFILEKPFSVLASDIGRLEYDILGEIGVPNSKVSIISMHPLASTNLTLVDFAVLADPKNASISLPALSVLRSSLVGLVLQQLNLSLTPSIFGHPSAFEILKFPGGITVIPAQSASIWEIMQILFNFTLDNSIVQIQKDLEELKDQLKIGLNLRSYENVYVQITNVNGSTVAPPVIVQASVLSDFGSRSLLPDRLKQLAHVITGSHAENFGLNHFVFGKVNKVVLSSYMEHSIGSPSPSPSPSTFPSPSPSLSPSLSPSSDPSRGSPYAAPSPSYPTSPYALTPSADHPHPPCLHGNEFAPSESPLSYAPELGPGPKPPSQSSFHGPSIQDHAPPPRHGPCFSSSLPTSSSIFHSHTPPPTNYALIPVSLQHKPLAPTSQMPEIHGPSPLQNEGSGKNLAPPILALSDISPSVSHAASYYAEIWLIGLLVESVILHLQLFFGTMF